MNVFSNPTASNCMFVWFWDVLWLNNNEPAVSQLFKDFFFSLPLLIKTLGGRQTANFRSRLIKDLTFHEGMYIAQHLSCQNFTLKSFCAETRFQCFYEHIRDGDFLPSHDSVQNRFSFRIDNVSLRMCRVPKVLDVHFADLAHSEARVKLRLLQ